MQKVKANNGHNKQEPNYSYISLQLNKRLTVLDIQDKATARPQAKPHAGGDRKTRLTGCPAADCKDTHTARRSPRVLSYRPPTRHELLLLTYHHR